MGEQTINIEKNTGTINIFNDSGEKRDQNKESISIPAIDKYSSPLNAHIELSKWGKKMHRVSFLVENPLIGQVLQQNYLTYNDKNKAKEVFDSIVGMMKALKEETEENLLHSAIITPRIRKQMMVYKDDLHKPESDDLSYRFINNDDNLELAEIPPGLVIHPVNQHFPDHEGIVRQASKIKSNIIRISNNHNFIKRLSYFDEFNSSWNNKNFDLCRFVSIMKPLNHESEKIKNIKRRALLKIRPALQSENKRKWILSNEKRVDEAISIMGEISLDQFIDSKEIDINDYDLFIFDADQTIWDGDCPAKDMQTPFTIENRDTVVDSNGKKISLRPGIRKALMALRSLGKDIGMISKSEKKGVDYQDQPVILMLKALDMLDLFNNMIVVEHDIPKSAFIPDGERTLFIDDDIENLEDVEKHSDADGVLSENMEYKFENDYDEDIEPLDVIELKDGENEESLLGWAENDDEIVFPVNNRVFVRGRITTAAKKENVDYVECPKDCGSPSGSMGVHFELEKKDGKMWIPKKRKEEYDETCKEIKEDLKSDSSMKADSNNWYKQSKRNYIPRSEQPEKPKDGKEYDLDHKNPLYKNKSKNKNKKENLQWIERDKHIKKSQEDGSFQNGGEKHQEQEKKKGKEKYKEYQSGAGQEKVKKERKEIGEKNFSKLQSERAKKRWQA